MSLASLCNFTATIERPKNSQDSSAGVTKNFDAPQLPANLTVRCTVQPLSTRERIAFAQRQIMVSHRLIFESNLAPLKGDRIRVTETNQLFVIVGFRNQAGRNRVWSIDASEMT